MDPLSNKRIVNLLLCWFFIGEFLFLFNVCVCVSTYLVRERQCLCAGVAFFVLGGARLASVSRKISPLPGDLTDVLQ